MGYIDPPIQERRSKRRGGCWLWGCGITAAIVVLVAVSCVTLFQYGKRTIAPSAETYLDLVTRGEYQASYARVSFEWKKTQTVEEFAAFHRMLWERLGSFHKGKVSGVKISSSTTTGTVARILYAAEFSHGDCEIHFTLKKVDGSWLVQGAHYRSDVLEGINRCPACSEENQMGARFCSSCGAALRDPHE